MECITFFERAIYYYYMYALCVTFPGAKNITSVGRLAWDLYEIFVGCKGRPRDILPRIMPCGINRLKIERLADHLCLLGGYVGQLNI